MNETTPQATHEETPVDDVRRVRRRLSREAGGNLHQLVEASRRAAEQFQDQLGLKPALQPNGEVVVER
jgi:hypothetical protein